MTNDQIKEIALANGFRLKEQPDGTQDLNPYVYEFAKKIKAVIDDEIQEHQDCIDSLSGVPDSVKEYALDSIKDLHGKLSESSEVASD